jgi:hypothetical protein
VAFLVRLLWLLLHLPSRHLIPLFLLYQIPGSLNLRLPNFRILPALAMPLKSCFLSIRRLTLCLNCHLTARVALCWHLGPRWWVLCFLVRFPLIFSLIGVILNQKRFSFSCWIGLSVNHHVFHSTHLFLYPFRNFAILGYSIFGLDL